MGNYDFSAWQAVYDRFRQWNLKGFWQKALGHLLHLKVRLADELDTKSAPSILYKIRGKTDAKRTNKKFYFAAGKSSRP